MGSAFGGTVGSFVGVAVGITAGQCANVWTVARTVALIAAIYGHDVDDTDGEVKKASKKREFVGEGWMWMCQSDVQSIRLSIMGTMALDHVSPTPPLNNNAPLCRCLPSTTRGEVEHCQAIHGYSHTVAC